MAASKQIHPNADVRMRGFAVRSTVDDAIAWIDAQAQSLDAETVPLAEAPGRVLARDVTSEVDVPQFARAMMDGFAVVANDTQGASSYNRIALSILGTAMPGVPFEGNVTAGTAVKIMTGAPMPEGADAVLPAELVEIEEKRVMIAGDVPPRKNLGQRGEDITTGTKILDAGRRLRPQDVGLLSSIGVSGVAVVRKPRVSILATGNELLPAGSRPDGYRISDANSPMLQALVNRDCGIVAHQAIVPDDREATLAALHEPADVVLVSGGSSVGEEDHVPSLLAEHGELAIHGIAMRPSSPAGMGVLEGRLVFLLPGNPVSCLCAYDFFAGRAIRMFSGLPLQWHYSSRRLPLSRKIVSQIGRTDYARVEIQNEKVVPLAISGASILSSTTRADGFVIVPSDSEGYPPGSRSRSFSV